MLILSHVLLHAIFRVNSESLFIVTSGVFLHTKLSSEGLWDSGAVYIVKAATWLRVELNFT